MMKGIKEFWDSMTPTEFLIVAIIIALILTMFRSSSERMDEREALYQECLNERVLSSFECKALAHEMTMLYR
jgi:hypothetical protein